MVGPKREQLIEQLTKARFLPILIDGSTDTGHTEDERFLVMRCAVDCNDEMFHTNMTYFAVVRPEQVDANSFLIACRVPCLDMGCKQSILSSVGRHWH